MKRLVVGWSALVALGVFLLPIPARAQFLVYDQQNDPQPITQKDNVAAVIPGQTFRAALPGIDFAEFYCNNYSGSPGQLRLQLRDGRGGGLLGTTGVIEVPGDNTFEYYRFVFPSRIVLNPGQTYALEMIQLGGGTVWAGHQFTDNYSDGAAYWDGFGMPSGWNFDYNFREGIIVVPEPATGALIGLGWVAMATARRRQPRSSDSSRGHGPR